MVHEFGWASHTRRCQWTSDQGVALESIGSEDPVAPGIGVDLLVAEDDLDLGAPDDVAGPGAGDDEALFVITDERAEIWVGALSGVSSVFDGLIVHVVASIVLTAGRHAEERSDHHNGTHGRSVRSVPDPMDGCGGEVWCGAGHRQNLFQEVSLRA